MLNILNNNGMMSSPIFNNFKSQASLYLKEKIKTARLVLTDVTPAEPLTEEATNGNQWPPYTRTMSVISRAAFEVDDYWRIVRFYTKEEFESDGHVIKEMGNFQYIDEKGKLSKRIFELLESEQLLTEERARARELTREIKGFGSFNQLRRSSLDGSFEYLSMRTYGRSNSYYTNYLNQHEKFRDLNESFLIQERNEQAQESPKNSNFWIVSEDLDNDNDNDLNLQQHITQALLH